METLIEYNGLSFVTETDSRNVHLGPVHMEVGDHR